MLVVVVVAVVVVVVVVAAAGATATATAAVAVVVVAVVAPWHAKGTKQPSLHKSLGAAGQGPHWRLGISPSILEVALHHLQLLQRRLLFELRLAGQFRGCTFSRRFEISWAIFFGGLVN